VVPAVPRHRTHPRPTRHEYLDRLKVVKVDVDASPQATLACGVQAMPTLALFHGGQMVGRMVGARPKSRLVKEIDDLLVQVTTPDRIAT
jgi:thioredoxin 1